MVLYSVYRKLHINNFVYEIQKCKKLDNKRFINRNKTTSVEEKVLLATSKPTQITLTRRKSSHGSRFLLEATYIGNICHESKKINLPGNVNGRVVEAQSR